MSQPQGESWSVEVEGVARFAWLCGEQAIYCDIERDAHVFYWLMHMVLPLYMRVERRMLMLHSAAIALNDHALLLGAESFGGGAERNETQILRILRTLGRGSGTTGSAARSRLDT